MKAKRINEISLKETRRLQTRIAGFDELLGGGFVSGQTMLFAGEPGVGKSTFILQVANKLAQRHKVLYASGEESLPQLRLRADRLNTLNPRIWCSEAICLEELFELINKLDPQFIIVDSLQMLHSLKLKIRQGSPSQMRFCLNALIKSCKKKEKNLIVIGHSTKSGLIAGLMTLQHMVDTTFFMRTTDDNLIEIYSRKNRFGASRIGWKVMMLPQGIYDASSKETAREIKLKWEKIEKILNKSWSNRLVVRSDMKYLFDKAFGKENLKKIQSFDIIYHLKD